MFSIRKFYFYTNIYFYYFRKNIHKLYTIIYEKTIPQAHSLIDGIPKPK